MRTTLNFHTTAASLILLMGISGCGPLNSGGAVGSRKLVNHGSLGRQNTQDAQGANQGQSQQTSTELLPPTDDIAPIRPVPGAAIAYDFIGTLTREGRNAAVSRMIIQSPNLKSATKVKVRGTLVNLRSSSQRESIDRDVDVRNGGIIDFTIQNLKPDTVYRMEGVSVTDISQGDQSGFSVNVKDPYFLATADESSLSKAKRRLAIQALSEAYDWDHGNYDYSKQYASGWGWCDNFYTWAAAREFTVRPGSGSTYYFRRYNALGDATRIPTIAESTSLAGDLIRYEGTSEGTHTFMVIAYDTDTQSLWNVEGNYNRRVMRSQRKIRSNWMHGHLSEQQVR